MASTQLHSPFTVCICVLFSFSAQILSHHWWLFPSCPSMSGSTTSTGYMCQVSLMSLLVTCRWTCLKVQALQADWPSTSSLIGSCQHASHPLCREIRSDSFHSCELCTFEDLRVQGAPKHPQRRSRVPKHIICISFCWLPKWTQPSELTAYQHKREGLSVISYRCIGRCSFDWYIRDKT